MTRGYYITRRCQLLYPQNLGNGEGVTQVGEVSLFILFRRRCPADESTVFWWRGGDAAREGLEAKERKSRAKLARESIVIRVKKESLE